MMKRAVFLAAIGAVGAAPALAQPPATDDPKEKIRRQIQECEEKIAKLRAEARDKNPSETSLEFADIKRQLGGNYALLGQLWEDLKEWHEASLCYSQAKSAFKIWVDITSSKSNQKKIPEFYTISILDYGRMKFKLGRFEDALEYAKSAKATNTSISGADFLLAQSYAALENYAKAKEAALSCLNIRLADKFSVFEMDQSKQELTANAMRLVGMIAYLQGDMAEAKSRWQEGAQKDGRFADRDPFDPDQAPLNAAIAKNPRDFAARMARIVYFRERATFQQEEERIRAKQAIDRTPNEVALLRNTVAAAKGGYINLLEIRSTQPYSFEQAALLDLEAALDLQPKSGAVYFERYVAQTNYNEKVPKLERKEGVYRQHPSLYFSLAVDYARRDPEVLHVMGAYFAQKRETPRVAVALLSHALLLAPSHPFAAAARKRRDEALKALPSPALKTPPPGTPKTALEWKERGNALSSGGDWRGALECYEKAVALDPKFADGYNNIGSVYSNLGCYDRAWEALDKAIALDPKHRLACLNRARVAVRVADHEKVMADGDRAIANAQTPAIKAEAMSLKADACLQRFRAEEGLRYATEAIALAPGYKEAWLLRGIAELYLGKDAVKSFEAAGDNPYVRLMRCLAVILAVPAGDNTYEAQVGRGRWKALENEAKPPDFDRVMAFIRLWRESELAPKRGTPPALCLEEFYRNLFQTRNVPS